MIHHINCCTMRPPSERLVNGFGSWIAKGRMVAHVLVVETSDGLTLVDSGIGLRDCAKPSRLGGGFVRMASPALDPAETAARQIERLGYARGDVRHIVLTHLDVDHAGGISDFPDAQIHVFRAEHDAAMSPRGIERERYRRAHFEHDVDGERFMGFDAVRAIVEPDVLLLPTTGHSRGHAAIAVRDGERWQLHCGDAYFHHREMRDPPSCPGGLTFFQKLVAHDEQQRVSNQRRLRAIALDPTSEAQIFCAHDMTELPSA
jgi:glyoxylase-like metal-dependent hydrolase (beta-lactamase superfamily II)